MNKQITINMPLPSAAAHVDDCLDFYGPLPWEQVSLAERVYLAWLLAQERGIQLEMLVDDDGKFSTQSRMAHELGVGDFEACARTYLEQLMTATGAAYFWSARANDWRERRREARLRESRALDPQ